MADDQKGTTSFLQLAHLGKALLLEKNVPDRERLVYDQQFRIELSPDNISPYLHERPADSWLESPINQPLTEYYSGGSCKCILAMDRSAASHERLRSAFGVRRTLRVESKVS